MKRILLISLFVLLRVGLSAQQDPQFYTKYVQSLAVNPLILGSNGSICGTLLTREQWMGI